MDRGSQLDEDDKDDKEDEEEAGGRGRQEEEATDIKSNNPHLAGGEKCGIIKLLLQLKTKLINKSTPPRSRPTASRA